MEETEVIELRREARVKARANMLWLYLVSLPDENELRLSHLQLCEALGLGLNRADIREAVAQLEDRGLITVERSHKPHRYTLNH